MWHSFSTTLDAFFSMIHSTRDALLSLAIAAARTPFCVAAASTFLRARIHASGSDGSTSRSVNDLRYRFLNRSSAPPSTGRSDPCSIAAATSFRTSSTFGLAISFLPPSSTRPARGTNTSARLFTLTRRVVERDERHEAFMTKPTIAVRVRSLKFDHTDPDAAGAQRFDEAVTAPIAAQADLDPLDGTPAPADAFPSRAVVHIISNRGSCTGWLFGPDIVA